MLISFGVRINSSSTIWGTMSLKTTLYEFVKVSFDDDEMLIIISLSSTRIFTEYAVRQCQKRKL